ncbi:MAG: tyrosine-type recombinase/integrase [Alphaproteobacteria bacterium]|nr:tyrosine-type recombinase/integrase [Alphaproteobacteria bacterium]
MSNFHKNQAKRYTYLTNQIIKELPLFFKNYFRAISVRTQPLTRYNYAIDARMFCEFIKNKYSVKRISQQLFGSITSSDIEEFLSELSDNRSSVSRKISSLKSFYKYFVSHEEFEHIEYNPTMNLIFPKIPKKDIIYLTSDEIKQFIYEVENYEKSIRNFPHKYIYYRKTKYRDLAIISLLLGTGIRVSECAGLNISDLDLRNNSIKIIRKGGKEQRVYFTNAVFGTISDYLDYERDDIEDIADDTTPLFYSLQKSRMSVRSIQRVVQKYVNEIIPYKSITAHKLRSSYATELYNKSNDLYLVSDALGHSSVDTTKKYANLSEKRRKEVIKYLEK